MPRQIKKISLFGASSSMREGDEKQPFSLCGLTVLLEGMWYWVGLVNCSSFSAPLTGLLPCHQWKVGSQIDRECHPQSCLY